MNWFEILTAIDQDLAATAHADGCRRCRGRMHRGDFPRKPRGGPADLPHGARDLIDVQSCIWVTAGEPAMNARG